MFDHGCRLGIARLAEEAIRSYKGKKQGESLTPADKIFASAIGGALGTWNQPIEVVRVEVRFLFLPSFLLLYLQFCADIYLLLASLADAKHGEIHLREPARKTHRPKHARVHLQGERDQGSLPRCDAAYRAGYLADDLHGVVRGLREGLGEGEAVNLPRALL